MGALEDTMLCVEAQSTTYCMILFLCKVKKSQIHGDGKMSVSRGWEEVIAGWGWSL